jgi:DNA-directed RNA polymerase specialized sigma24 family protein
MSIEEDGEIVARVLAEDKTAFGALIEHHRASALAFSRRILDANEAEDAVQEAFLAPYPPRRRGTVRQHGVPKVQERVACR